MTRHRTSIGLVSLVLAVFVLTIRVHRVNEPRGPQLAPRTVHLLYLDSLRHAVLRRIAITPQWPEPPQRSGRRPANPTPPNHDAFSTLAVSLASPASH